MQDRRKFLKQTAITAFGFGIFTTFPYCKNVKNAEIESGFIALPRSTPEQQGVSSKAILRFLDAIEKSGQEFHGLQIVRNGHVITEGYWAPFQKGLKHTLYSLSKSFTSTAVGLLVDANDLDIETPVVNFFPKDLPAEPSDNLKAMKIKHLLTMNTGHDVEPIFKMMKNKNKSWVKLFLAQEVTHQPGSHFLYNTAATYMLSVIVQSLTGQTVLDLLQEKIFDSLNIKGADWEDGPSVYNAGGYGLRLSTDDIAKFGQLYLQKGEWEGEQLISSEWVEAATKVQTTSQEGDNDWSQGYGYQFWRCKPAPGFYRGDGAFGQFCIVIPQKNTVIAINSESSDMQASMDLVWDYILPALVDVPKLEKEEASYKKLQDKLSNLSIPTRTYLSTNSLEKEITGKVYDFGKNDLRLNTIRFSFKNDTCKIELSVGDVVYDLTCGNGKWITEGNDKALPEDYFAIPGRTDVLSKVAAYYTWKDEQNLLINLKFIENIHGDQWTCIFEKNQMNVVFQDQKSIFDSTLIPRPELIGKYK